MNELDIIKSYLVKLGVEIDDADIKKWDNTLSKLDNSFKAFATVVGKSILG